MCTYVVYANDTVVAEMDSRPAAIIAARKLAHRAIDAVAVAVYGSVDQFLMEAHLMGVEGAPSALVLAA